MGVEYVLLGSEGVELTPLIACGRGAGMLASSCRHLLSWFPCGQLQVPGSHAPGMCGNLPRYTPMVLCISSTALRWSSYAAGAASPAQY
jgi:hypothetical protein